MLTHPLLNGLKWVEQLSILNPNLAHLLNRSSWVDLFTTEPLYQA